LAIGSGCTLYLKGPTVVLALSSSATGFATTKLSLPVDTNLLGVAVYGQGFVLDSFSAVGVACSSLRRIVVGD